MYEDGTLAVTGGALTILGIGTGLWWIFGGIAIAAGLGILAVRLVAQRRARAAE
ncbi:hypothetical protein G7068_06745 [Leucobacter viscericola]|uniref:Uncharacterized protein n=1 Tax=Leucobacter viscericola TaxID=2714935 RepID=A0A6G7XEQ8_9MICO|nr:hypothetical protein [Leucobacter viscericola]QIK62929.1 hypothetical protein G7068_06745 [Leucobacter viscericola]